MTVDNRPSLWVMPRPQVLHNDFQAGNRPYPQAMRNCDLAARRAALTLTSEGHPRSNGDGPLTTNRSTETNRG